MEGENKPDTQPGLQPVTTIRGNIDKCKNIEDVFEREGCISKVAQNTLDYRLCDSLTDNDNRDQCYFQVNYEIKNISLCDKIIFLNKDACYGELAFMIDSISVCESITDKDKQTRCKAMVKKDTRLCDKIVDETSRYECYTPVAIKAKDHSICNKIPETVKSTGGYPIREYCLSFMALNMNDASICELISSDLKEICKSNIENK